MAAFFHRNCPLETVAAHVRKQSAAGCFDLAAAVRSFRDGDEDEISDVVISGDYSGIDGSGLSFNRVIFVDCRFRGGDFSRASFIDCIVWNSDLSNGMFAASFWAASCLGESKAIGADFTGCRMRHIRFAGCNLQFGNFTQCRLAGILAEKSDFSEAVFAETILGGATLKEVKLNRATFVKTPLDNINLTGCSLENTRFSDSAAELRGAIVNPSQAAELAKLLGVVIE
ncbi:MAG: pentapeptide repeat-containing protein [Victivallaceae bacterium]